MAWRFAAVIAGTGILACSSHQGEPSTEVAPSVLGPTWSPPLRTGCEVGSIPDEAAGGVCVLPGVRTCAAGFEPDGRGGCIAILPAVACPRGKMAVPGERACRAVQPCGQGRWGDVATDARTQFVDAAYTGGGSDGSQARPWTTVRAAYSAAEPGATIAIAEGRYVEAVVTTSKAVTFWGRCPELVEMVSSRPELAPFIVRGGANGTVVRGVALTGPGAGVMTSGARDVIVDRVWIHDVVSFPVGVADAWGPASVTVRDSLVEDNATLVAVSVLSADLVLERSVVRNTTPAPGDDRGGMAIDVEQRGADLPLGRAVVRSSVLERNTEHGILVDGGIVELVDSVVRETQSTPTGSFGRGITVQSQTSLAKSSVSVRGSILQGNHEIGIVDIASDLDVEGTVIRDTKPAPRSGGGIGLQIQVSVEKKGGAPMARVRSTLVEASRQGGVVAISAVARFRSLLIRDVEPRADGALGVGLAVQYDYKPGARPQDAVPSDVVIEGGRVERTHLLGVSVVGSRLRADSLLVDDTRAQLSDGLFGDGVVVLGGAAPASLEMNGSRVSRSARAAIANFAGHVSLAGSDMDCNALALDGEDLEDGPFRFEDRGGNACGCAPARVFCRVLSANLEPPRLGAAR
jgi:hypothetical protein